ncbi:acetyltransferase [Sphingobacterium sp. N143]|uniref:acetyltransferase n=1 Tax=Sphingobacterium sp. N143 TaxID=2746727 RepID=UPI00257627E4|nr:acetyltransferase [Sphingobacterium sp. N143]MDM1295958.1 acetyltransferase [Sphingobacterium sp. N143]
MYDNKDIAIIGYSGHSLVVLDAANEAGVLVSHYCEREEKSFNPYKLKYLGDESSEYFNWNNVNNFIVGIGDNQIRRKIANLVISKDKQLVSITHPSAYISTNSSVGVGNFFAVNSIINAFARIGNNCILNTACVIEHECILLDHVHIGPGAILAGNVTVGESTFIGANSVVKQGVTIGENVIVGAGSVVLHDIPNDEIWVGNPAKKLK